MFNHCIKLGYASVALSDNHNLASHTSRRRAAVIIFSLGIPGESLIATERDLAVDDGTVTGT